VEQPVSIGYMRISKVDLRNKVPRVPSAAAE
jgi:hypothetical protein